MATFRLQRVLDVRRLIEKEKEKELSTARLKLQQEQSVLHQIEGRKDTFVEKMNACMIQNVRQLSGYYHYLNMLMSSIEEQLSVLHKTERLVENKRQKLLQATKNRKILDRLKERHQQEIRLLDEAKQQAFLDELARRNVPA